MRNKIMIKILVPLSICVFSTCPALAASLDCTKAKTTVEKMICADNELAKLDEELASSYTAALKKISDSDALRREQKEWLKERNLCTDIECIGNRYRQRLASLKSGFVTIYPPDVSEFKLDCKNPKTEGEKAICKAVGDIEKQKSLAEMYTDMIPVLQWALMRSKDKQKVLQDQRKWQKETRDVCKDFVCLGSAYDRRMEELLAMWDRPESCYALRPRLNKEKIPDQLDNDGNLPPIEPVCQALEENFNQFCGKPPIQHGLPIAPRFKEQFTFPQWVQLDPKANMTLIEEFIRAPWENDKFKDSPDRIWKNEHLRIEAALRARCLTFAKADIDIYNLGKAQPGFRLDYSTCKQENLNLDKNIQWIARVQIHHSPAIVRELFKEYFPIGRSQEGEAFMFCGRTYVYYAQPGENSWHINIYERIKFPGSTETDLHKRNLCEIKYNPQKQEENK